ncbi:hypothetical protein KFK09_007508 [Dendrobium nobile]|uniref:Uncharacterized protein n=1 Tax=Dendrobium nobile TaxID=94219 RepID=A0A8T3BX29_DENNO|nr:hypothetical protein KFK09_007508 [Dendrobium nobile]
MCVLNLLPKSRNPLNGFDRTKSSSQPKSRFAGDSLLLEQASSSDESCFMAFSEAGAGGYDRAGFFFWQRI